MKTPSRFDTQRVDLAGFEAWLRGQLQGVAFAAVVTVVLQMIRALFEQNTLLRARIQGRRPKPPSERLSALERQLSFAFAVPRNDVVPPAVDTPAGTPAPEVKPEDKPPRPKPRKRQPLPPHLPRVIVPNDVPEGRRFCETCQVPMSRVGVRGVEYIEMIPAKIIVCRRLDETVACPRCDAIVCATVPPSILDGGRLGPVMVTEALCSKVLDGMPIERQARNLQRSTEVTISASTLGRSVAAVLDLLVPLAECIRQQIRSCEHVQLDSTGLRVLDRKAPLGIFRDTLWVLLGNRKWIYFAALESGTADAIEGLLQDVEAESYQCDGTSTLNFVEVKWQRRRPGCHAHARRKLVEAVRCGDLRAMEMLTLYAKIFAIEKQAIREKIDPAALQQRREAQSLPLLGELREKVLELAPHAEPKSPLGEATTYLQRQWLRLCLFVFDGEIEITNNRSERALRPWTLGQHTWLFVGDQKNATRLAAGFSVLHTALAHELDPRAYIHAVVARLIAGHSHTRLRELLPDAMLRAHPELADSLRVRPPVDATVCEDTPSQELAA